MRQGVDTVLVRAFAVSGMFLRRNKSSCLAGRKQGHQEMGKGKTFPCQKVK
jgi:hypothetical protein